MTQPRVGKRAKTLSDNHPRHDYIANRGLPVPECPKGLCVMPQGDKFQDVKVKKDDAEYPAWQRSRHSSPSTGKPRTWRRAAACYLNNRERKVCDTS